MDLPKGVPVSVVARTIIPDGASSDIRINGKKLLVEAPSSRGEFTLDHVYGPEHTPEHVFERSIAPVLKALVEGVSVSLIFSGSTNSAKSEDARVILTLAVEELIRTLDQKRQILDKQRGRGKRLGKGFEFSIRLSAFEVFDESIKDLFDPRRRDLQVVENAALGQVVEGASVRGPFSNTDQVIDSFEETMENRTTVISEFGPASKYTSTIWIADVFQQTPGSSDHHVSSLQSRFTVVELPGTEKLCEDVSTLRMREGPTLNKGLHTLKVVTDALAESGDPGSGAFAPYKESKLTQLLKESLGGNVIGVAIAGLVMGEAEASLATMTLMNTLHATATYPIVNDDRAQGLLRRYRQEIINLRFELEAGHGTKLDAGEEQEFLIRINELEGKAVQSGLELMRVKEEKEQVYNKLVEFRKKYNELVDAKSNVQAALIQSEEEKLKISKALVDLRLENNQLVEKSETEKYELVSKLLNAENEVLQLEMKEENRDKTNANLADELSAQQLKHKKLQEEFIQLQTHFAKVEANYKDELVKNEELGVELLNLVNHKNTLRGEIDTLRREHTRLQKDSTDLRTRCKEYIAQQESLKNKIKLTEREREDLRNERARLEISLKRGELEFESTRLELNRVSQDAVHQKDAEILNLKRMNETLQQNIQTQKEMLLNRIKGIEHALQKATRKSNDLENMVQERETLLVESRTSLQRLEEKLQAETEVFRAKILEYASTDAEKLPEGEDNSSTSNKEEEDDQQGDKNLVNTKNSNNTEQLRQEFVSSFERREHELRKSIQSSEEKFENMLSKNRILFSKYQRIKSELDDLLPQLEMHQSAASTDKNNVDGETAEHGTSNPRVSAEETNPKGWWTSPAVVAEDENIQQELQKREIEQQKSIGTLSEKVKLLNNELNQAKERLYVVSEQSQREVREWQRKYNDLVSQVELLEKQKFNLQEENESLARRKGAEQAGLDENATAELRKLQEELLKKIDGLQESKQVISNQLTHDESEDTLGPLPGSPSRRSLISGVGDLSHAELTDENAKLKKELIMLRAERRKTRRQTLMSKADSNKSEGRVPELLTKLTVAEEELESYKRIMKQSLAKNKKALNKVKAEATFWKQQAIAAGVSSSLKPPS